MTPEAVSAPPSLISPQAVPKIQAAPEHHGPSAVEPRSPIEACFTADAVPDGRAIRRPVSAEGLPRAATVNPCRLCAPLGASIAFRGVRGGVPILHGAQGCATYIRRYLISHFREPIDIGSSSFGESAVVFGGESKLFEAIDNITAKYNPEVIGVATTCLAETIGDDPRIYLASRRKTHPEAPPVIPVGTASYRSGHIVGFQNTLKALVEAFSPGGIASEGPVAEITHESAGILIPMLSPADLRYLKSVYSEFGLKPILAPDYSETLDGEAWGEYHSLPEGGTGAEEFRALARLPEILELGEYPPESESGGTVLQSHGVKRRVLPLPIGVEASDSFTAYLSELSGRKIPGILLSRRGRLIDAYADAHKYLYGVRIAVICSEHLTPAFVRFCAELGMDTVLAASGSPENVLRRSLMANPPHEIHNGIEILDDSDFLQVEEALDRLKPDLVFSSSKPYRICRDRNIPLIRVDFPIHDRFGAQRILNLGYSGTQRLLDTITNIILEKRQNDSPVGFSYQ